MEGTITGTIQEVNLIAAYVSSTASAYVETTTSGKRVSL
jgi:hypothetical protein